MIEAFGVLADGQVVDRIRIGAAGIAVDVLTLGATLHRLEIGGRNLVLCHDTLEGYVGSPFYAGASCGRFANRIAGGRFLIDGVPHRLLTNDGANTLHGGPVGFDKYVWTVVEHTSDMVELEMASPDGDQGFPGAVSVHAVYEVTGDETPEVRLTYTATTDAPTVINLTNHVYFNAVGAGSGPADDQLLQVFASSVTEVGDGLIPTGRIVPVGDLDCREPRAIAAVAPLDNNFVIDGWPGTGLIPHARLHSAISGITIGVFSDQPGLQVYTADGMDVPRAGIAFETQNFPDAPNQPSFPNSVLRPGETYRTETLWRFNRPVRPVDASR